MQHPKQTQPGQPQPVPNYVGYSRPLPDAIGHTEHILVRDGWVVGQWTSAQEGLPLAQALASTLTGKHIQELRTHGFRRCSREVTTVLVESFRASLQQKRRGNQHTGG